MSLNTLPSSYTLIHAALASQSHTDHSVVVYTSMDRVIFDAHPSPIYGCHSINDLSTVLPEINAKFTIQVQNVYTRRAIDLAPYPQSEVDLDPGLSMRVVDDARDLTQILHYEAVFIRTDGSLVIWGDDEDATVSFWIDIICRLQSQSQAGTAIPFTTPVAGLPGNYGINPGDTMLWDNAPLPYLDNFAYLLSFADNLPAWGADPQGYCEASTYPSSQRSLMTSAEPSEGSLGFAFPQRARSPFSDATTASSLVNSPSTADLEGIFPSYAPSVYVGEEDEVGSNISLDFSFSLVDRGVSPALSSSQCTIPGSTPPVFEQASSSSSSRQHSVVETSAPGPFAHGIDQKASYEVEEARHHFPQPITNVNGSTSDAATGNADVDLRSASNTHALKRSHSVIATGSAPARLTTPLPDVEHIQPEDDKRRKFLAIAPAPPPASASTFTSAPAPPFPSPPPSISTPASGRPQRRPGNRRRGGGTKTGKNARGKRHPCEFCGKTFSRLQDQHRHTTTSCNASPLRSTVDCPECGSILSRLDAAQRHWRQHENPTCPTPDWVSCRS